MYHVLLRCLNPYCSGRWSRTVELTTRQMTREAVLILIVVEDGLVRTAVTEFLKVRGVLILIVVEDGLVLIHS